MYMLVNFIYMFQVIYKSFKCRLKFVQSAFIHKEFCMQKNKVKEENQCGINWKSAKLRLFSFKQISNLTQKDWVCSHWHIQWKIVSFSVKQKLHTLFSTTPMSFRIEFVTRILQQIFVWNHLNLTSLIFLYLQKLLSIQYPFPAFSPNFCMH